MNSGETSSVYLLSYELRASAENPERDGIGGAFVSAWVKAASLEDARRRAHEHLAASGWVVLTVANEQGIARPPAAGEALTYYQQAQTEGEVFVIHAFPPDEPDA